MKKIIALALVLVLSLSMATVAFAAPSATPTDGSEYAVAGMNPGSKYKVGSDKFTEVAEGLTTTGGGLAPEDKYFTSEYFTVTYKVGRGANLLESVTLKDGYLVVEFKKNLELERPNIENFKFDKVAVKAIKDAKTASGTITKGTILYTLASEALLADAKVGYVVKDQYLTKTGIDTTAAGAGVAANAKINLNTAGAAGLYNFKKGTHADAVDYRDVTFTATDFFADVRVYKDEKIFLSPSYKADIEIVKANPDAALTFIGFEGTPTFTANASIEISADKDSFLYEIKDGKLVKSNLKWDDSIYAFTGKTRTLGDYVISDVELKAPAATEEDSKNPNTGANDFVGVAVALAVVSLVAAGAVSLKK